MFQSFKEVKRNINHAHSPFLCITNLCISKCLLYHHPISRYLPIYSLSVSLPHYNVSFAKAGKSLPCCNPSPLYSAQHTVDPSKNVFRDSGSHSRKYMLSLPFLTSEWCALSLSSRAKTARLAQVR